MENGKCGVNEINVKIMSLMFTKKFDAEKKVAREPKKNAMKMIKKS